MKNFNMLSTECMVRKYICLEQKVDFHIGANFVVSTVCFNTLA